VRVRVPASSANLGPGFDVLALALDLYLDVEARRATQTSIAWSGTGADEVPLDSTNLIVRAVREIMPEGSVRLRVRNAIPIGRGLGSSAASIVAGLMIGARLGRERLPAGHLLEHAFPLEGHGDNLAAAIFGGFCLVSSGGSGVTAHRLPWPAAWRAVFFVPNALSPTHEARRLVPKRPERGDAVFNLARVGEWMLAVSRRDHRLLASAMEDRMHQPGRSRAYPYLNPAIAAAKSSGAWGAALSGAGGSVIAIAPGARSDQVGDAMVEAARASGIAGVALTLRASSKGASVIEAA
jgi:homoserine kinase